jgi:hypothetical protein
MNVIAHDNPGVQLQSFMLDTMGQTPHNNIPVIISGQDIYPVNNGASDKMWEIRINHYVSGRHKSKTMSGLETALSCMTPVGSQHDGLAPDRRQTN